MMQVSDQTNHLTKNHPKQNGEVDDDSSVDLSSTGLSTGNVDADTSEFSEDLAKKETQSVFRFFPRI